MKVRASPVREHRFVVDLIRSAVWNRRPEDDGTHICWSKVKDLLWMHRGLLPSLATVLPQSALPAELAAEVAPLTQLLRRRTSRLRLELRRILPALGRAELDSIVLKGPALAGTIYRNKIDRYYGDLDLLLKRQDVERACDVLATIGYKPAMTVARPEWYAQHHFHIQLKSPAGLMLELHWELTTPHDYIRFDLDGIRERSVTCELEGQAASIMCPEDALLHLASQQLDLEDCFSDLRRTFDAALILKKGLEDEAALAQRAQESGTAPALWIYLDIVHTIADVPAPGRLEARLRPGRLRKYCIRSLDVPGIALGKLVTRHGGVADLVQWWCAPFISTALRLVFRFLVPGEGHFLQRGLSLDEISPWLAHTRLFVERLIFFGKLAGYQLFCLFRPRR